MKISSARMFWFCNNSVTTFPTYSKCIDLNVSLYTVPAEILYLQKYLTNFQKLFFGRTMRKVSIVVENYNCTEILVLQKRHYTFSNIWKCKIFSFSIYTVPAEMLYLQKDFMNFQKLSFAWKMMKVANVVENFKTKISVLLKFSTTIATFIIFQAKESFWKFIKSFWRYSISAGTV